jgi:hypothetical protein
MFYSCEEILGVFVRGNSGGQGDFIAGLLLDGDQLAMGQPDEGMEPEDGPDKACEHAHKRILITSSLSQVPRKTIETLYRLSQVPYHKFPGKL